jgi:hypothetical protein
MKKSLLFLTLPFLGGALAVQGQILQTDFSGVSRVGVAHTDANDATADGNRNVGISGATWTTGGGLALAAITGTLTMGDYTWSNIGAGVVLTTGDGGVWRSTQSADARTTGTSEADRANFQFNTGSIGGSAAAPMDVAVFNLVFSVTTAFSPEISFRAGTAQTNGTWDNNTAANNGDFEVRISPITLSDNNGTVNFANAVSVGSGEIGAGAGPVVSTSTIATINPGTYLLEIRLSGQGGQRASIDDLALIPEPSTYAALIGLLALGLVAWRRRR